MSAYFLNIGVAILFPRVIFWLPIVCVLSAVHSAIWVAAKTSAKEIGH